MNILCIFNTPTSNKANIDTHLHNHTLAPATMRIIRPRLGCLIVVRHGVPIHRCSRRGSHRSILRRICFLHTGKGRQIGRWKWGGTGLTLLYRLIARTSSMNTSSTLIRCFADVSMHTAPNCLARLVPSVGVAKISVVTEAWRGGRTYLAGPPDGRSPDHTCWRQQQRGSSPCP